MKSVNKQNKNEGKNERIKYLSDHVERKPIGEIADRFQKVAKEFAVS